MSVLKAKSTAGDDIARKFTSKSSKSAEKDFQEISDVPEAIGKKLSMATRDLTESEDEIEPTTEDLAPSAFPSAKKAKSVSSVSSICSLSLSCS